MSIGFVGLGIMGAPMARNILRAGFPLTVYNRTRSKCDTLREMGASVADSLRDLASRSDIVVTIVSDTPDVEAVLFGEDGLAAAMKPGSVVIDMSTISPRATAQFAERLRARPVSMLDAPVSGGESGAKAGSLSIMVGGDREVFDRCLPLLQSMGKNIVYTGTNGNGQKTKLVNQIVGSLNLIAAVEGLRVAQAAGLDPENTMRAVGAGAAGSWMVTHLGPKIIAGDFAPGFSIHLHQKDLRLAKEFVEEMRLDAPGTLLSYELFTAALEAGLGECGNQGLFRLWEPAPPV